MDTITTARSRAYLAADVVDNAVEFFSSFLQLLPDSPDSNTGVCRRIPDYSMLFFVREYSFIYSIDWLYMCIYSQSRICI